MNRLWLGMILAGLCATPFPLMAQMGGEKDEPKEPKEEPGEPDFDVDAYAAELIKNSDTDKDGKVTLDEVVKKFTDFNKAMHAAGEDEEKLAKVWETYGYPMGSYYFGTADANGDKTVTKEELVAAIKAMNDGKELKLTAVQCEEMATIEFYEMSYDKNDDGAITKDEADESWEYLVDNDTDKDGKITKEEYYKARLEVLKTAYGVGGGSTDPKTDPTTDPKADPKTDPKVDPKTPTTGEGELKKELFTLYTKKGRTWTMKVSSKVGDFESITHMKYEVVNVTDEEAEVKTTMLDKDLKEMAGMPASTFKVSFRVPKATSGEAPKATATPTTTEEKITVKAGEFECIKTTIEAGGNKTTAWTSKKYAGLCVKSETTGQATSTMELVEFNE